MEEDYSKTVVFKINGGLITFKVTEEDKDYFDTAKEILRERLADLKNNYSAYSTGQDLVTVLAVNSMVDFLKINEKYTKLKNEVEKRLEDIQTRLDD